MGQVCAKHNEYYEDRCRWCEAPETDATMLPYAPIHIPVIIGPLAPPATCWSTLADHISHNNVLLRRLRAKAYDDRLRLAMLPPNDGHGIFE